MSSLLLIIIINIIIIIIIIITLNLIIQSINPIGLQPALVPTELGHPDHK